MNSYSLETFNPARRDADRLTASQPMDAETTEMGIYMGMGNLGQVRKVSEEEYLKIVDSEALSKLFAEIAATTDEAQQAALKKKLPFRVVGVEKFSGNRRCMDEAELLRRVITIDIDHIDDDERRRLVHLITSREFTTHWHVRMVERSARGGLHVEVIWPEGMTADEVQQAFSADTNVKVDAAPKDPCRAIFFSPEEHVIYREYEYFQQVPTWTKEEYMQLSRSAATPTMAETAQPVATPMPLTTTANPVAQPKAAAPSGEATLYPTQHKGVEYKALVSIMDTMLGGYPAEGSRNTHLLNMAVNFAPICDYKAEWLMQFLPTYGLSEAEWRQTIINGCKYDKKLAPSKKIQAALSALQAAATPETHETTQQAPVMPEGRQLNRVVKTLISRVPPHVRQAVAMHLFPSLGVHLNGVKFPYLDGVLHEATFMSILVGETGSGKGFIDPVIEAIMADIKERDADEKAKDREWRRKAAIKSANQKGEERPKVVVQYTDSNFTLPALIQRMADNQGKFIYMKMNELKLLDMLSGGVRGHQFELLKLAYDPDNRYGQVRISEKSVNETVCVRMNMNISTQPAICRHYFRNNLTDGVISRITFTSLPNREIGAAMPRQGSYDKLFQDELKPYIDNLNRAHGIIRCPQMETLIRRLDEECKDFAILTNNKVYENLSHRALCTAFLRGMVLYVAQGCKWDKTIENFTVWSLHNDLWHKMQLFGEAIAAEEQRSLAANNSSTHWQSNLLEKLPDEFSREEVRLLYEGKKDMSRNLVNNYKRRGWLVFNEQTQRYSKTAQYFERRNRFMQSLGTTQAQKN